MKLLLLLAALCGSALADHKEGHYGTKVGQLRSMHHGVNGVVYALDEKTILVKDFEYDGAGPDAFFWVGTQGEPSSVGTILPYPFDGKFYEYEDASAPILTGRFNKVDIKLTLPTTLKVSSLKWFSVWCRAFKVNFADVTFPANFKLTNDSEIPPSSSNSDLDFERNVDSSSPPRQQQPNSKHDGGNRHDGLPPPLLPPDSNSQPGHRDHSHDPDAEPEGAAEPNTKCGRPVCGAGSLSASILATVVMAMISVRWW